MDRITALGKIRKCLALAASDNVHEAARALTQAQKLMQEHGITDADVDLADVAISASKAASVTPLHWDAALAHMVGRAFGCECLRLSGLLPIQPDSPRIRQRADWMFVGVGGSSEVASYAYQVLVRQCSQARRRHMAEQPKRCKAATLTARGDAFASGWVLGVSELVGRFAGNEICDSKISAYIAHRWPGAATLKSRDRTVGRNVRLDSRYEGYSQGRNARLHGAVEADPKSAVQALAAPQQEVTP